MIDPPKSSIFSTFVNHPDRHAFNIEHRTSNMTGARMLAWTLGVECSMLNVSPSLWISAANKFDSPIFVARLTAFI
jgi:hypothetical protein